MRNIKIILSSILIGFMIFAESPHSSAANVIEHQPIVSTWAQNEVNQAYQLGLSLTHGQMLIIKLQSQDSNMWK